MKNEKHPLSEVSEADFRKYQARKFGQANPERMENPFWLAMAESNLHPFDAAEHYGQKGFKHEPIWTLNRLGMSRTLMDDGILFIGGEYDDHYDPDFCIYNDVILRKLDGTVEIRGYPYHDFIPTDFHTATPDNNGNVWIIGGIGYEKDREYWKTKVHRLDLRDYVIREVETGDDGPGWIHGHRDHYIEQENLILVYGGEILTAGGRGKNTGVFGLDLLTMRWKRFQPYEFDLVSILSKPIED